MRLVRRAWRPSAGEALAARDLGEGPGDPLRYVTLARFFAENTSVQAGIAGTLKADHFRNGSNAPRADHFRSAPMNRHSQSPLGCLKRADIVAKVFFGGGTQILRPVDAAIE